MMSVKRTPPPSRPSTPSGALTTLIQNKSKSDTDLSDKSTISLAFGAPDKSEEQTASVTDLILKRKRDDEFSRDEMIEMFTLLQKQQEDRFAVLMKEQDKKFGALMDKVQGGIQTHTDQNMDISTSIDFLGKKYDEMMARINILEQEKSNDRRYIRDLETKVEIMDRNQRKTCIEVRNVPKKAGESKEDLICVVQSIGEALSIPMQAADVRDAYRINTHKGTDQPIVAELLNVTLKEKILRSIKSYNKKYSSNKFNTSNLKLEGAQKPIFVSESLTIQAKKLFFLAREFAKKANYKFCWTSRGRIYLRRADGAPLIKVNKESDLEDINVE